MANTTMNEGKESIIDGTITWSGSTIKAALCNSTYVPNADQQFVDDGTGSDAQSGRLTGTTDQTIGSKATGKDNTGDFAYMDGADVTFSAVPTSQTAAWVAIYVDSGAENTSRVLVALDIADTPTNGGDITIVFATPANGGIIKFT